MTSINKVYSQSSNNDGSRRTKCKKASRTLASDIARTRASNSRLSIFPTPLSSLFSSLSSSPSPSPSPPLLSPPLPHHSHRPPLLSHYPPLPFPLLPHRRR